MSEQALQSLVDEWFERRELGAEVALADLCSEFPELVNELERRIQIIQQLDKLANQESDQPLRTELEIQQEPAGVAFVTGSGVRVSSLGGFLLQRVLGQGGMGTVFLADDRQLKRQVAIKVIKVAVSESARQRFLREAQSMAAVDHEHVMPIYAIGEDQRTPYLVMPVLKGESLAERLQREPKLAVNEACRIGREIALGLAAAHELGLIHRDIKPSNIWLAGSQGRVKILDFGLARSVEQDDGMTQTGAVIGTPAYMAPEQAGKNRGTRPSDLFSLGAVLYRMATGIQPFADESVLTTLHNLATLQPTPPHELDDDIPGPLSDLILKLLEKSPEARPPSATVVAEALAQIAEHSPSSPAGSSSSTHRSGLAAVTLPASRAWARPISLSSRRGVLLTLGGVACAILAGLILWQLAPPPHAPANQRNSHEGVAANVRAKDTSKPVADKSRREEPVAKENSRAVASPAAELTPIAPTAVVPTVAPASGTYADLDGTTSFIEAPIVDDGKGPLTVEMWVWNLPMSFREISAFLCCGGGNYIFLSHDRLNIHMTDVTGERRLSEILKAQAPSGSRWSHVALVANDDGQNRYYLDGKLQGESRQSEPRPATIRPWRFGFTQWDDKETRLWGGLDEIHIRRGAHYKENFQPQRRSEPDETTLALYHLDDSDPALVRDASRHERHARLVGNGKFRPESLPPAGMLRQPNQVWRPPNSITNGMQGLAWSPDSKQLARGGWDHFYVSRVDDLEDDVRKYTFDFGDIDQMLWTTPETIVVSTQSGRVAAISLEDGREQRVRWQVDRKGRFMQLSTNAERTIVAATVYNQKEPTNSGVLLIDAVTGEVKREIKAVNNDLLAATMFPDGSLLTAKGAPGSYRVILELQNLATDQVEHLTTVKSFLTFTRLRPATDGKHVAIVDFGHRFGVLGIPSLEQKFHGDLPSNLVDGGVTDDAQLAFASTAEGLTVFDCANNRRLVYFPRLYSSSLSPDNRWLAGSKDDLLYLWSVDAVRKDIQAAIPTPPK